MKKVLSFLMVGVMSFSVLTGVAFAETNTKKEIKNEKKVQVQAEKAEKKAEIAKKKEENSQSRAEVKALIQKIKENRKIVLSLHNSLEIANKEAKARIKELKKAENVTPEIAESIKNYLKQIKDLRVEFAKTEGSIKDGMENFKNSKTTKNFEAMKTSLNLVIAKQEARIAKIKKITEIYLKIAEIRVPTALVKTSAPVAPVTT